MISIWEAVFAVDIFLGDFEGGPEVFGGEGLRASETFLFVAPLAVDGFRCLSIRSDLDIRGRSDVLLILGLNFFSV